MIARVALPSDFAALRAALYRGEVFLLPPSPLRAALAGRMMTEIATELAADRRAPPGRAPSSTAVAGDPSDPREAQHRLDDHAFFERVGRLRRRFYTEPRWHRAARALLRELGAPRAECVFDPIRLRTIRHRGDEDPRARPIFHGHRDTWYANPQGQVTAWLALHDVTPADSFVFWPDEFARPVANDSDAFDHDAWTRGGRARKIGWQDPDTGREAVYPRLLEEPPGPTWTFSAPAGALLLFSGQHLHRTTPNRTGRTRFSADLRFVHLEDHARGVGAPNVDNRSTGSALAEHVR